MALTWADVVAVAPELAATPSGSQTALLAYAVAQCNAEAWGSLLANGTVYLAAHMATLARQRGGGALTSEAVGQVRRTYATLQHVYGSLGSTSYGMEFRRLARLLPTVLGAVP